MTKNISLQDAIDMMKTGKVSDLVDNPELNQFLNSIDEYATDILKDKDPEYLAGCVSLVQACTLGVMIQESMRGGDIQALLQLAQLITDDSFQKTIALAFKATIGIAALEELR